jgi:AmpD protein
MMHLDAVSGRIEGIRFCPSPNFDARPTGAVVEVIVIHAISLPPGQFGGPAIEQLFCNALDHEAHPYYQKLVGLEVSAHFLIRRDGGIVQFVPLHQRAWHAGRSWCQGRGRVNDFSIGIELEGSDDQPFDEAQYQALAQLTRGIMKYYPAITRDRLYGHADIAPGRKADPGPHFDWKHYLELVAA